MTQFGIYSQMTPRSDASPARGQWNLNNAYQYISEANAGYHWDVMHGVNLDFKGAQTAKIHRVRSIRSGGIKMVGPPSRKLDGFIF